MAPKLLIFNFDGTGNEPRDSEQFTSEHFKEDAAISNILKLHLLLGGKLHPHAPSHFSEQQSFYYAGIGMQGSAVKRVLNQILAPRNAEVGSILNQALHDFQRHYQAGDQVLLTGFSRGAALARRFAKCLEQFISANVYLCVFDTVASLGLSKIAKATCGAEHVIFSDCDVASNVAAALHCVSLDDKRRAFEPTLFNASPKVKEIWFAGAHSDIGGGFYRDGLSDVCLRYAIEWLLDLPIAIRLLTTKQVDYAALLPLDGGLLIDEDDLAIHPNPLAVSHQQDYLWYSANFKNVDRTCTVMVDNQLSSELPLIHHSVALRIFHVASYRPESLKGLQYRLEYPSGETLTFKGLSAHIELPKQNLTVLQEGESTECLVYAAEPYNCTGILLEKGATYRFTPELDGYWFDNGVKVAATGWQRAGVTVGEKSTPITLLEPFRRCPQASWFALIGSINGKDEWVFAINEGADVKIAQSGEFTPFANDISRYYGANTGKIKVTVTRLG
ncbi:phospholipase effector Tle1 domain-containing protein [Pseudoalteromonas fenneropenaei]|uniref:Phospholipase effector Tle1 domain-containing protein n=1 Tax=Pseudoalteromonas fenneropenaei TaxID=1737459 RepID=A0ABV7CGB5_9GAMM